MVLDAIKSGAGMIETLINPYFIKNKYWKVLKEELMLLLNICADHRVKLRPCFDYVNYNDPEILQLRELLEELEFTEVVSGSGFLTDDTAEHAIFIESLTRLSKLKITAQGRIYSPQHVQFFEAAGAIGVKLKNCNILENILGKK